MLQTQSMREFILNRVESNISFFSDTESFTSQQENKLLLWQALCIEVRSALISITDDSLG